MKLTPILAAALAPAALILASCGNSVGGGGGSGGSGNSSSTATSTTSTGCGPDTSAPNETLSGTTDPAMGMFTMAEALDGLPDGPGPLRAIIDTDLGTLTCTLRDDKTPNAVANFIGLARGIRPWKV